jgi:hypothetical protein
MMAKRILSIRVLSYFTGCILLVGCAPRAAVVAPPVVPVTVETPRPELAPRAVREVSVPNSYRAAILRGTRSETGAPGPGHWQNRVSYRIEVELDPATAQVRGYQRIVYRNNSPDPLPSIVLNLYQNVFSEGVPRNRFVPITGGVSLLRVTVSGAELERQPGNVIPVTGESPTAPTGYAVQGTLGRIRLPRPIETGDSAIVEIEWEHLVPPAPNFRTGWEETLGSRVFHVAQWYPQVAAFDDLAGWSTTPYLGDGEFHLDYGDFDVAITLPVGWLVAATGTLANPDEVLTEEARARLAAALRSDTITRIVTAADLTADNATQPAIGGQLTWRFTALDVRDFAFSTSNGYVWDSTRILVREDGGGTRAAAIHALYRPDAPNWREAARFARHAMDTFNDYLIPYLYPQLSVAEGPVGGMEYPMLMFIGKPAAPESLYGVIAHEAAHQWFPMMVGSDEAAYAWLDEGLATFLENRAAGDFFGHHDPFAPDRNAYLNVAGSDVEVPMMRHTDLVTPFGARGVAAYAKPGTLLRSLEWIVGPETFRDALADFSRAWLLANATPWDFFATFERHAGRSLAWFFEPWWFETGTHRHALVEVVGGGTGRAEVRVEDRGDNPVPAIVVGTTATGATVRGTIPVEVWLEGARTATVVLEADTPIVRVELDPERIFPGLEGDETVWVADPA